MENSQSDTTVVSQRIASSLREEILSGVISPGERIRQEEIAAQFGASRLPVREALRILETDGLVTLVANTGAWAAKLQREECIELYEIREKLEPLLISESILYLTDEQIDHLEQLSIQIRDTKDINDFLKLDRKFHLASYAGTTHANLRTMVERLWNTTQHYRRAFTRLVWTTQRRWIVDHEHELLVDAIRRRDPEDASAIILMHIRRTRTQLSEHPEIFSENEHQT